MKINKYLTITNNIELTSLPKEEKFHIFIGNIPNRFWFIIKIYKNNSSMKLCKMKSGNFSILNRNTDEVLFTCSDLHEAKVEFIVIQSITDGGMGSKIFEKAMNL